MRPKIMGASLVVLMTFMGMGKFQHVSPEQLEDQRWREVLLLASSNKAGSRPKLEKISLEDRNADVSRLARVILDLWDDQANTYFTERPHTLRSSCLTPEQLHDVKGIVDKATLVILQIEVDESGRQTLAKIVDASDNAALSEFVLRVAQTWRFCPAKPGDNYVRGALTVTCLIEVG